MTMDETAAAPSAAAEDAPPYPPTLGSIGASPSPPSEPGSYAGTLDASGDGGRAERTTPDRRCGGPMARWYACALLAALTSVALFVFTVALSASSLRRSNEALSIARANSEAIAAGAGSSGVAFDGSTAAGAEQDTIPVPPPAPAAERAPTPPLAPEPKPATPPVPEAEATASPTTRPTERPTTGAPTEPHPLDPKWYQTTHADWIFLSNEVGESQNDWHVASHLCNKQERTLCKYEAYCPNGQGGEPYGGGPPKTHNWASLEEIQWSPFQYDSDAVLLTDPSLTHYIQVGILPADKGGDDENHFGRCWKYDDWTNGSGVMVEDVWEGKNRMWILCCLRPEAEGGGGVRGLRGDGSQ